MPWNPDQYHKFQSERAAPFYDLLALVDARPNLKAIDLGCGSGELTSQLADRLPNSDVTGLDSSPEMLTKAASFARAGLVFQAGDLSALLGDWDLIFSNAALQWSDNHAQLIPQLFARLNPGAQIAVQVPSNHNHISHQIYRETANEEPFKSILQGFQRIAPVLPIDEYAQTLFDCGAENIVVFEKIYAHVLEDSDAVVEWISGTALVPYFERLSEHKDEFVKAIREKMREALPGRPVFYPFRRILFSARKPA
ncbi:MAG TPA: methyltransferase domain-containing protein [Anaerolineales bacterium]|nr:methyltransferase domain-containing protein [Anaerolineales bacterium]HNQ93353.1 methyltransferase domain-containing protein [Anaerolineales bacterium]HNS61447.1 methyltransferase domain-containing protein [Anaerolineales bacterium]